MLAITCGRPPYRLPTPHCLTVVSPMLSGDTSHPARSNLHLSDKARIPGALQASLLDIYLTLFCSDILSTTDPHPTLLSSAH